MSILTANGIPLRRIEDLKAADAKTGGRFFLKKSYTSGLVLRGKNSAFFVVRDTVPELYMSRYTVYRLWADGNRDGIKPGKIERVSVGRSFTNESAALNVASIAAMCDTDEPLCFMDLSHTSTEDANWSIVTTAVALEYDPDGIPGKHPAARLDESEVQSALSYIMEFLDGSLEFQDGDLIYSPPPPPLFAYFCQMCAVIAINGFDGCGLCSHLNECRHDVAVTEYTTKWRVFSLGEGAVASETERCAACGDCPNLYTIMDGRTFRAQIEER